MARVWSSGFELNSTSSNVEFDSVSNFSIQTGTVRSGAYAGQVNVTTSTGTLRQILFGSNQTSIGYARMYINISSLPSANVQIMRFENTANTSQGNLRLNTDGTIGLFQAGGAQVGSSSSALSTGAWHRLEIKNDATGSGALEFRLNGTSVASGANSAQGTWARFAFGGFGQNSTFNIFYDDVGVNDSSGLFQNSWLGAGKILHLYPNAAGDANGFSVGVGGTAGSANNYTRVGGASPAESGEPPTPNDAISYNGSAVLSSEDLFNVADSGIGASDTVNVVSVGVRMADLVGADATAAFKVELEKTGSGTKAQSGTLIPNSTTWKTNAAATPWAYPLITYQDPDSAAWTQSTLDSMQVGYIQTATNVQTIAVSTVWALVDYTPQAEVTTTSTSSSTSSTSSSTSSTSSSTSSTSSSISTSSTSSSISTSSTSSSTSVSTSTSFSTSTSTSTSSTSLSISTSSTSSSVSTSSTSTSISTSSTSTSISISSTSSSTSTSTSTTSQSTSSSISTSSTSGSTSISTSSTSSSTSISSSTSMSTSTSATTITTTSTSSTSNSTSSTTTLPFDPRVMARIRQPVLR